MNLDIIINHFLPATYPDEGPGFADTVSPTNASEAVLIVGAGAVGENSNGAGYISGDFSLVVVDLLLVLMVLVVLVYLLLVLVVLMHLVVVQTKKQTDIVGHILLVRVLGSGYRVDTRVSTSRCNTFSRFWFWLSTLQLWWWWFWISRRWWYSRPRRLYWWCWWWFWIF